jgi:hypothetical protein
MSISSSPDAGRCYSAPRLVSGKLDGEFVGDAFEHLCLVQGLLVKRKKDGGQPVSSARAVL